MTDTTRYANETEILNAARHVAETVLGPKAQETDQADGPVRENFRALGEAGLLGMGIPRHYGGLDASAALQREYTEILASHCGVTTFTQAQHHGPSRMIANGPNNALKETLLPDLATGVHMCGVSFAHLRRPGPPVLRAEIVPGGYRLYGTAPWVTGWGLMRQFVFGATLPDGRFVYLWSPAKRADFPELFADVSPDNGDWGSWDVSPPIALCAMNASATVEIAMQGWFIPQAHWLSESDRETMQKHDRANVLGATPMPLGCASAGIRVLCETAERRGIPAVSRAAEAFKNEWTEVRGKIQEWHSRTADPAFFENAITLRAWAIELAMRTAHAAAAASSGAANTLTHPAQRLLREAMFYTVQAQTREVMEATLSRLERSL